MAEFSKLIITKNGQKLLAKMIAGTNNIAFTKISTSSTTYTITQLEGRLHFQCSADQSARKNHPHQ